MAIENYRLNPITDYSWKRGYKNLLDAEIGSWFKTSRWIKHSLIWVFAINFVLVLTTIGSPADRESAMGTYFLYSIFSSIWTIFGGIIVASSTIVGEKKNGTAEWVLSKPVSREIYLLSKFVALSLGVLVTMVLIPGMFTYGFVGLWSGYWLDPLRFIVTLLTIYISIMFFVSCTFMLGTFFSSQNQVAGGGILLIFIVLNLGGLLPYAEWFLPLNLSIPINGSSSLVYDLLRGSEYNMYPAFIAVCYIIIFTIIAIIRFQKEDL